MERRNTRQRELVLSSVRKLHDHATADEVYADVKKENPSISKATVYRNLKVLSAEGIIRKIFVPHASSRYDDRTNPHCHVRCVECDRVFDIDLKKTPDLAGDIVDDKGIKIIETDILFSGICPECLKKRK